MCIWPDRQYVTEWVGGGDIHHVSFDEDLGAALLVFESAVNDEEYSKFLKKQEGYIIELLLEGGTVAQNGVTIQMLPLVKH